MEIANNFVIISIIGSTVFYPCDAVSCERAIELAANTKGVCFVRTSRPATAVVYDNNTVFQVNKWLYGAIIWQHLKQINE